MTLQALVSSLHRTRNPQWATLTRLIFAIVQARGQRHRNPLRSLQRCQTPIEAPWNPEGMLNLLRLIHRPQGLDIVRPFNTRSFLS